MAAITVTTVAKAATALLTNEKARKGIGWLLVAILSPIIIVIFLLLCFLAGGSKHNVDTVQLCFNGGPLPTYTPADFNLYITDMRTSFSKLDEAIAAVNEQTEDEELDAIRVKSVFYALYFGQDSPSARDHRKFVDCFVTYEQRTRDVEVPNPDYVEPDTDASEPESTEPETITVTETYTVAVPIRYPATVYQNIASSLGIRATFEQMTNAQEIYYQVAYNGVAPEGTDLNDWIVSLTDPDAPFVGADGFVSPVGPGWRSMVSSEFGGRTDPLTGEWNDHRGIDLTSYEGHPIYAALDGTVVLVWTGGGSSYGKYLVIDHGGGFVTLYAHNSKILVTEGQAVTAGQQIAEMGSTGRVTGTHVHFEVLINGVLQNPRSYLP